MSEDVKIFHRIASLPMEIQYSIYKYDATYIEEFNKIVKYINKMLCSRYIYFKFKNKYKYKYLYPYSTYMLFGKKSDKYIICKIVKRSEFSKVLETYSFYYYQLLLYTKILIIDNNK